MQAKPTRQDGTTNLPLALGTALVVGLALALGTVRRRREPHEDREDEIRHW